MILGIGAGRPGSITERTVRAILEETGLESEFVSLSDKTIGGCTECLACAADNRCKLADDFLPISEKLLAAEALVFGAPNFYDRLNARGHALLERAAYSFHHNNVYAIGGRPYVSVSTEWIRPRLGRPGDPVREAVDFFLEHASRMHRVGHVTAFGYGCCFTCGFGHDCTAGGAYTEKSVRIGGFEPEDLPPTYDEQPETQKAVKTAAAALKSALRQ